MAFILLCCLFLLCILLLSTYLLYQYSLTMINPLLQGRLIQYLFHLLHPDNFFLITNVSSFFKLNLIFIGTKYEKPWFKFPFFFIFMLLTHYPNAVAFIYLFFFLLSTKWEKEKYISWWLLIEKNGFIFVSHV